MGSSMQYSKSLQQLPEPANRLLLRQLEPSGCTLLRLVPHQRLQQLVFPWDMATAAAVLAAGAAVQLPQEGRATGDR
jgi:hypothetical protein